MVEKLFFWIMEVAMMNSFILYKSTRPGPLTKPQVKALTFVSFKKQLIKQMEAKAVSLMDINVGSSTDIVRRPVGRPKKNAPPSKIEITTPGQHIIVKGTNLIRCKVCSTPQTIKRTNYYCKTCPSNPSIHPDCFEAFHKA